MDTSNIGCLLYVLLLSSVAAVSEDSKDTKGDKMSSVATYEEVAKVQDTPGVYLIEIREPKEVQETGLIPGSIHIPEGQVEQELKLDSETFKSKYGVDAPKLDSPIIFTCRSGRRAEAAMKKLEKLGYTNSRYYAGSWLEWASKNE